MENNTTVIAGMKTEEALRMSLIVGGAAAILAMVLAILVVICIVKIRKLNKKYNVFMKGSTGKDLEASIFTRFAEIDTIKSDIEFMSGKLNIACDMLLTAYQKMSIVKYDAFKEMGGKLSFSLALLSETNNGFVMNAVHSREGCYTYVKEIIDGNAVIMLSDEEKEALEMAKKSLD